MRAQIPPAVLLLKCHSDLLHWKKHCLKGRKTGRLTGTLKKSKQHRRLFSAPARPTLRTTAPSKPRSSLQMPRTKGQRNQTLERRRAMKLFWFNRRIFPVESRMFFQETTRIKLSFHLYWGRVFQVISIRSHMIDGALHLITVDHFLENQTTPTLDFSCYTVDKSQVFEQKFVWGDIYFSIKELSLEEVHQPTRQDV